MLFIALEMWHMLLEINHSPWHAYTSNFGFYSITFGPFLYLYVKKLTEENASFEVTDLLHFVPYLLFGLAHLTFFTNRPLLSNNIEMDQGWFILTMSRVITLVASLTVYSVLALRRIKKHRKSIKDTFSFHSSDINLGWLRHVTVIFMVTYLVLIINMLAGNIVQALVHTSHLIPAIGLTFFCFSLSYFGFNQPALFLPGIGENSIREQENLTLTAVRRKEYLTKLARYMEDEQPYLNPELTIQQLADGMKVPKHYLTEIFKKELQKNFFTLINDYRVEEVKSKLLNVQEKKSVLQLALESGFNSKSSFNAIFRQYTGVTPTEFRRQHTA